LPGGGWGLAGGRLGQVAAVATFCLPIAGLRIAPIARSQGSRRSRGRRCALAIGLPRQDACWSPHTTTRAESQSIGHTHLAPHGLDLTAPER
jgi:hypothetical protein